MGRTPRDNEASVEWAITGLISAGTIVSYNAFELVNRKTGRAHQLHITSGGIQFGFGAGGGEPSYTLFKTRKAVTFDTYDWAGVVISSISPGGFSATELLIFDGPVVPNLSRPKYFARIVLKDVGVTLPGVTLAAHGVAKVAYGSGVPSGIVPRSAIEIEQEFPPDKRLSLVKQTGMEPALLIPGEVLFDFDEATLNSSATEVLKKAVAIINRRESGKVTIVGHTDSKGSRSYNQQLSEKRAEAVKRWFIPRIPEAMFFFTKGEGELKPIAPNKNPDGSDNPSGRRKNRRVEIVFSKW